MPIDFRYAPASGDISGKSFEEQTVQAFNELGRQIDNIDGHSQEAIEKAENAEAIANNALDSVNAAVSAANTATEAANAATSMAGNALAAANSAQTAANNALDAAAVATTRADSAAQNAESALSLSTTAQAAAQNASESANSAVQTSQVALEIAQDSSDIYPPTSEAVNLNDYFTAPAKLHIVAAGSTNMPDGAALPAYFSVSISSDVTSATQIFWSDDNPKAVYTRVAVITQPETEGEDPSAVWGEWSAVGGGRDSIKAWVNFVGTPGGTIQDSENVAGVARNSAGNYTITFLTPLSSAAYVVVGMAQSSVTAGWLQRISVSISRTVAPTVNAVTILTGSGDDNSGGDAAVDSNFTCVAIIGR